jgi:alkylation response protein AidB-like acyl-CoA dehydrogenase
VHPDPLNVVAPPEVNRYRDRAASLFASFSDAAPQWERDGVVPQELFARVGSDDLLRERWEKGEVEGLRKGLSLVAEASRLSGSAGLVIGLHSEAFLGTLHDARSDVQRATFEDGLRGGIVGCMASTEPEGGSDVASVRTVATRRGSGWHIFGSKRYITGGNSATHAIVSAAVVDEARRHPTLFLVPLEYAGVTRSVRFATLGLRGCDTAAIGFDTIVSDEHRVTPIGMGSVGLARALRRERLATCAQLVRGAEDALMLAIAFARQRPSGAHTLIDRQVIRHRLAELSARLYTSQAMLATAIIQIEMGQRCDTEVAMCKLVIAREVNAVLDGALQVFGARGYTEDYPIERWWRDARLARIGGGADEALCEALASRLDIGNEVVEDTLERMTSAVEDRVSAAGIHPPHNGPEL